MIAAISIAVCVGAHAKRFILVRHRPLAAPLYETGSSFGQLVVISGRRHRGRLFHGAEEPVY
jgi:hypothetical protein